MSKILIVDDEADIRQLIHRYAQRDGHEITEASDGLEAIELCKKNNYDIIIMDIMMPEIDGYTASKEIHKSKDIPILMLSARGAEYDKLFGFEVGVDDYVVKPFSPKELLARINVIINRHKHSADNIERPKTKIIFDDLVIDTLGRSVSVAGKKIILTAKEFDLLVYLTKNCGIVLTRDNILNAIWGYEYCGEDRTVDWQIKLLRKKLGNCRRYIITIRGVGYKFEP